MPVRALVFVVLTLRQWSEPTLQALEGAKAQADLQRDPSHPWLGAAPDRINALDDEGSKVSHELFPLSTTSQASPSWPQRLPTATGCSQVHCPLPPRPICFLAPAVSDDFIRIVPRPINRSPIRSPLSSKLQPLMHFQDKHRANSARHARSPALSCHARALLLPT